MTEVNNNRNDLIKMLALVEEIIRTNSRLHGILTNLMNNPEEVSNVKTSIDDLSDKVNILKKYNIPSLPLIEEEPVLVPSLKDISPKEDPDYEAPLPEPKSEKKTPPRRKRVPRKMRKHKLEEELARDEKDTQRPNKPLGSKKKLPSPDIDSI